MRPPCVELGRGRDRIRIPILYEDRSVMAIDKPAGWLLVPFSWDRTPRNLQSTLAASVAAGHFWARSRNLKFIRHVHRLDGDTTGILLLGKSIGAVESYGELFESRKMAKRYLAVVHGVPSQTDWTCQAPLARDPAVPGRMIIDPQQGKESETSFHLLATAGDISLVEARPLTGRTHQIRLHLLQAGYPIVGDLLYGPEAGTLKLPLKRRPRFPLGLRAIGLAYHDPFLHKQVHIEAPTRDFLLAFGFAHGTRTPTR